jgi:phospholipid transport system substrate-binding protein
MRGIRAASSVALAGLMALAFAHTASAADVAPPDQVVKQTTDQLQKEIGAREKEFKADPRKLYAFVDQVIVPKFDQKYIAQLILARHWKSASEDQRARFQVAFKNMLVHTYADALVEYHNDVKPEWQPLRMAPDATDVTVQSRLVRSSGKPPLPIGFAMRLKDGQWKVYDIIIENLSLITSFRSQINSEIKRSSLDALIQKLEAGQAIAPPIKSDSGKPGKS